MSFILTVYMRDRIVMAANKKPAIRHLLERIMRVFRWRVLKRNTLLYARRVGISICGQSEINEQPVPWYVHSLLSRQSWEEDPQVDDIALFLYDYFSEMDPIPDLVFHVAGYEDTASPEEQRVWFVDPAQGVVKRLNTEGVPGVAWDTTYPVLTREDVSAKSLTDILVITPEETGWVGKSSIWSCRSKAGTD